jgi:hypothetical protein
MPTAARPGMMSAERNIQWPMTLGDGAGFAVEHAAD